MELMNYPGRVNPKIDGFHVGIPFVYNPLACLKLFLFEAVWYRISCTIEMRSFMEFYAHQGGPRQDLLQGTYLRRPR